jgi:protein gp37
MENSNIAWTHNTQNFWLGCDKVAPECAHCYIGRTLRQQGREPWGQLYRTKTWNNPAKWQKQAEAQGTCYRVFTNSLSDFFHAEADAWREEAWDIVKDTPNLVWLILTKRPELVASRLPKDWGGGYPNVWLGTSVGCNQTLNKMDSLRKIPVHPQALRFVSCEPLLEDIADQINLDGFRWLIVGGESGSGQEYLWDKAKDWRKEFDVAGRRTMKLEWARRLLEKSRAARIPFFFKQITSFRSGIGEDALGRVFHEFPPAPQGKWADKTPFDGPALANISSMPATKQLSPIQLAKAKAVAEVAAKEKAKASAQRQQLEGEIASVAGATTIDDGRKNFSKTPVVGGQSDVAKTTDGAFDREAELRQLCDDADAKATELIGLYHSLQVRISGELFPLLLRIKTLLPHGEWTPWFEAFCKRHNITTSIRTVQRVFESLTDNKLLTNGKPVRKSSLNAAVVQAENNLADAKEKLAKSAEGGNTQAKDYLAKYEKEYADAVAAAKAQTVDATEKPPAELKINKKLANIVEVGERYIRVMERIVYSDSVTLTDRQRHDLEKASKAWRKCLRDARELSFAVKIIEGQNA